MLAQVLQSIIHHSIDQLIAPSSKVLKMLQIPISENPGLLGIWLHVACTQVQLQHVGAMRAQHVYLASADQLAAQRPGKKLLAWQGSNAFPMAAPIDCVSYLREHQLQPCLMTWLVMHRS